MHRNNLFQSFKLAPNLDLNNRLIMAPLTRCMADDNLVPTETMAAYYGRRADTGLIIGEATIVSADGQGYPNTPGLYNDTQVDGWRRVTRRVHDNGGKIFAQLWHTGRVSHSVFHAGEKPIAPSAIGLAGRVPRMQGLEYGEPRAMLEADIERVIADFARAASNAKRAGFDGVEIHAGNGYLIDQFLHYQSNTRTDHWGGSPQNMTRFLLRIVDAVKAEIEHVGIRLSPVGYFNMEYDARDIEVFDALLPQLRDQELCYLHTGMYEDSAIDYLNGSVSQYLRRNFLGPVIASGGYSPESASDAITAGDADLVAIGRPMIANADYIRKVSQGAVLQEYDESMLATLY